MSFHLYFFAIFISLWGSTHDSADCWTGALTDPRLPATASNVCTTDARLGGVGRVPPPNKNPGYAGDRHISGLRLPSSLIAAADMV